MRSRNFVKPSEFCFSIQYDSELGGFYSVFAKIGRRNLFIYDHDLLFIMPTGFYALSDIENLYGFNMDPIEARRILKNKRFVEDMNLI